MPAEAPVTITVFPRGSIYKSLTQLPGNGEAPLEVTYPEMNAD